MAGEILNCKTCGPMKQNAAGEWEPCEAPANPPAPAKPADKPDKETPPAAPEPDPDAGLFYKLNLGGD